MYKTDLKAIATIHIETSSTIHCLDVPAAHRLRMRQMIDRNVCTEKAECLSPARSIKILSEKGVGRLAPVGTYRRPDPCTQQTSVIVKKDGRFFGLASHKRLACRRQWP